MSCRGPVLPAEGIQDNGHVCRGVTGEEWAGRRTSASVLYPAILSSMPVAACNSMYISGTSVLGRLEDDPTRGGNRYEQLVTFRLPGWKHWTSTARFCIAQSSKSSRSSAVVHRAKSKIPRSLHHPGTDTDTDGAAASCTHGHGVFVVTREVQPCICRC